LFAGGRERQTILANLPSADDAVGLGGDSVAQLAI
jgi:hypothetical protein